MLSRVIQLSINPPRAIIRPNILGPIKVVRQDTGAVLFDGIIENPLPFTLTASPDGADLVVFVAPTE